jgi:hypothetical protein
MINYTINASNRESFFEKVKQLDPTVLWEAKIVERKSKRSNLQNSTYWRFVNEFGEHFGYDKDFTHDLLRYKFLYEIVDFDGQEARRLLSTTKLNTKDMAEYLDRCMRWAAQSGFYFEL